MQFRTQITPNPSEFKIQHSHQIFSVGSCFAANIGKRLNDLKFQNHLNPFGILYNPISILNCLSRLSGSQSFEANDLIENQEFWHSFEHHGHFSGIDQKAVLANIQKAFQQSKNFLKNTNRLILTFGTANVFLYRKTGQIVANCHKISNSNFIKRRLSIEEINSQYLPFFKRLKIRNPDLQIIITVSPVRHIRDGVLENQRSKAVLLLAIETLSKALDFVHYFPSYEILMDDLRDYRFYNSDMIHPNEVALNYIWLLFSETFFETKTKELNQKIERIIAALSHQPIHPNSLAHQHFLAKQLEKIQALEAAYSSISFKAEKEKLGLELGTK